LRPRPRDRPPELALRKATAGWRSHANLGLARCFDLRNPAESGSHPPFRSRRRPKLAPRRPPRARPPFTLAATLLRALRASVFEVRECPTTSATTYDVRALVPELPILARRKAATLLLLLTHQADFLAEAMTRGEPHFVRLSKPHDRFLLLSQVFPIPILRESRHPRRLAPAEC